MLKAKGNYKVLKDVGSYEEFNNFINTYSIENTQTGERKINGLYINSGLNKRYFCNHCKTIGPTTEVSWNHTARCPNCSAKLLSIRPKDYELVYYNEDNKFYRIDFDFEISDNREVINISHEKTLLLEVQEDKFIYNNKSEKVSKHNLTYCFSTMNTINRTIIDVLEEKLQARNDENINFINNELNFSLSEFINKNLSFFTHSTIYIAELLMYKRINLKEWYKEDYSQIFIRMIQTISGNSYCSTCKENNLCEGHFFNEDFYTPDKLLSHVPTWAKKNQKSLNDYISWINFSDSSFIGNNKIKELAKKVIKYNEDVFNTLIYLSETENFNFNVFLISLDELIERQLADMDYSEALEIAISFILEHKYLSFEGGYTQDIINAFERNIIFLKSNNFDVNKYNIKRKMLNSISNKKYLQAEYKLPDCKAKMFHLMVEKDPLKAYELLNNRRKLPEDEYAKLIKEFY